MRKPGKRGCRKKIIRNKSVKEGEIKNKESKGYDKAGEKRIASASYSQDVMRTSSLTLSSEFLSIQLYTLER